MMANNSHGNPNYPTDDHDDDDTSPIINDQDDDVDDNNTDKPDDKSAPLISFSQLFRHAGCFEKFLIFVGSVCAIAHGAGLPVMMIIFGKMLDSFIHHASQPNGTNTSDLNNTSQPPGTDDFMHVMKNYAIYYCITGACVFVVATFQLSCWMMSANSQGQKIRVALFRNILRQNIGWFDTHEVGQLNTRMSDDVTKVVDGIGDKVAILLQSISSFVAGISVSFFYGWKLTLVIISVSPLLVLCGAFIGQVVMALTTKSASAYAKAGAVAEEVFSSIRTVAAFGGEKKEFDRYTKNLTDAKVIDIKMGLMLGIGIGLMMLTLFSTYALAFWYGSKLVREDEHYTPGNMLVIFFNILIGAFALGGTGQVMQNIGTARGAAYELWKILDTESEIDSMSEGGRTEYCLTGNIRLNNVHFSYPSRDDVKVLTGVNLQVNSGQTVALVGHSGCGKSTVVQLIQRFYDPENGTVLLDNIDIKQLNLKWMRSHIGVVSQEPVLFDTTIAENIKFGRDDVSQSEIDAACRDAKAYDFIQNLPKKYDTLVGEGGAQLSGGQKQRIAIARALVRDPKILLLDEATSALDTESEASVQAALDNARRGRTTIVIAHRLSTIRTADVICGLKDGIIVETGTHEELMKIENGVYQILVNRQTINDDNGISFERGISVEEITTHNLHRQTSVTSHKLEGPLSVDKEEEEDIPVVPVWRIWKINAPEWYLIVVGVICSLANGAIQPLFAIFFAEILNVFTLPIDQQPAKANFYSLMFLAIGVGSGLSTLISTVTMATSGARLTERLRGRSFHSMISQDISFFDDKYHSTGALTTRLATETSLVSGATGQRLTTLLASLGGITAGVAIGFYYSWQLTLLVLAFAPFIVISGYIEMKVVSGQAKSNDKALENAGKLSVEAISNIRTVSSLGKEQWFLDHYTKSTRKPYIRSIRSSQLAGLAYGVAEGFLFFAYAASYYLGAHLIVKGELEFGEMMKVLSAIIFSAMSVGQSSAWAPDYKKARLAADKIFKLIDRETKINPFSTEGLQPPLVKGNLNFNGVEFSYPTRATVPVLQGLDLTVKHGETVALVGSSGCGKSTTIQLIERFYDAGKGQVFLDSNALPSLNVGWLRAQLGLVSQEPVLFDATIAENIAYGDNSRTIPHHQIIQAARDANIHSFIESLPQGYDTNCGDKGTQLSGGQKQRIAIARALVRDPKILLLDEATSALDTESEQIVQEALERAQEGRTSIVIAHRLSTIVNSDKIFVIENGKIVEAGTHSELLAKKGAYYKLNQTQFTVTSSV